MTYATAKLNTEKFKNSGNTVVPALTNDWIITTSSLYKSGTRVYLSSQKLNVEINCGESGLFFTRTLNKGNLSFSNEGFKKEDLPFKTKINEYVAYSKNGFIFPDEFQESLDIIEEKTNLYFYKPSELVKGEIYQNLEEEYFIFIGKLDDEVVLLRKDTLVKYKDVDDKKYYLIKIDKEKYDKNKEIVFIRILSKVSTNKFWKAIGMVSNDVISQHKKDFYLKKYSNLFFFVDNPIQIKKESDIRYNLKVTFIEHNDNFFLFNNLFHSFDTVSKKDLNFLYPNDKLKKDHFGGDSYLSFFQIKKDFFDAIEEFRKNSEEIFFIKPFIIEEKMVTYFSLLNQIKFY